MPADRLPFSLPDFTRWMWVSDRAAAVWQPRVARISQAWPAVERAAIHAGLRQCALQHVTVDDLPSFAAQRARDGLVTLPLAFEGQPRAPYAAVAVAVPSGSAAACRVAVGTGDAVVALSNAWHASDQARIAELLGYPPCCSAFFDRVWVSERAVDTTWAMAGGMDDAVRDADGLTCEVSGPPEANILLRWLGVRAVSHLPCRADCAPSAAVGDGMLQVARAAGFHDEAAWILEMLSWPVEWSALHGIAEIKTPVVKIATRTDATAAKHIVRRAGTSYPAEGAHGLVFPYRLTRPTAVRPDTAASADTSASVLDLSEGKPSGRTNGVAGVEALVVHRPAAWRFTDNGFTSHAGMADAHRPIVELAVRHLSDRRGTVLDLGCGNGALLAALLARLPALVAHGVEVDAAKVERARQVAPAAAVTTGDMFDTASAWAVSAPDLVILMPGRLLEVDAPRADGLRAWLQARGSVLLVYAYDDWLTRWGSLEGMCTRAGLIVRSIEPGGRAALAVVDEIGESTARA